MPDRTLRVAVPIAVVIPAHICTEMYGQSLRHACRKRSLWTSVPSVLERLSGRRSDWAAGLPGEVQAKQ